MARTFEVEIKSLLGSKENCDLLKQSLRTVCPELQLVGTNKQLNHYFIDGDVQKLGEFLKSHLSPEQKKELDKITSEGKNFSLRSREVDGKVLFVIKASLGEDTSANGVKRIEFEATLPLTLAELDAIFVQAGFVYQAKWSREREEYDTGTMHVCIDKNAGYGYLVEFEKMVSNEEEIEAASQEIKNFMKEVGVEELAQDRLERMFAHYNAHWPEYYGTDKVFTIE